MELYIINDRRYNVGTVKLQKRTSEKKTFIAVKYLFVIRMLPIKFSLDRPRQSAFEKITKSITTPRAAWQGLG